MKAFLKDRRGATAIEYSMIAAFVAIGIISAIGAIGLSVEDMFAKLLPAFADHG
jgi:pilus assembly protein Flp/PilA